jgi:hypothetical protein
MSQDSNKILNFSNLLPGRILRLLSPLRNHRDSSGSGLETFVRHDRTHFTNAN